MAKTIRGVNDLASQNPELASEWHPTKNGELQPQNIAYASKKKVWWLGRCGHEWEAVVGSRKIGRGCPICAGIQILSGFNDLASHSEILTHEWDYEKNEKKPTEVGYGTHEYAWWICSICGFSWKAEIRGRYNGNGCPECTKKHMSEKMHYIRLRKSGSLAETQSPILKEWNYEKNNDISPENVTPRASRKVWWKCSECDYEWRATIGNRMRGSGCPACSGAKINEGVNDFKSCHPELLLEWNYEKNHVRPEELHASSGEKVFWKCKYGHEWETTIHDRVTKGVGCPFCSKHYKTSFGEQSIYYYIKKKFPDAINSYREEFLGRSEIDIFIPSLQLGIEYDGQRYHKDVEKDIRKDEICRQNGITLIRVREPLCIKYEREAPTFIMQKIDYENLTMIISNIYEYLNIKDDSVNVEKQKSHIVAIFHGVAIKDSIAQQYPELAVQWAKENKPLQPDNIPASKVKDKYYWRCINCNHLWQASLSERIKGSGCPVCSNKVVIKGKNDFATTHPVLVSEWNYDRNTKITPQDITYGSNKNVWWRCSICGFEWNTRVNRRVNGSSCPACVKNQRKKKVLQYDLEGNLIQTFSSVVEAAKVTGISSAGISNACNAKRGTHVANKYIWMYENVAN